MLSRQHDLLFHNNNDLSVTAYAVMWMHAQWQGGN